MVRVTFFFLTIAELVTTTHIPLGATSELSPSTLDREGPCGGAHHFLSLTFLYSKSHIRGDQAMLSLRSGYPRGWSVVVRGL